MTTDERLRAVAANPRVPTPSAVVLQVLEKARQPDCSLAELGRVLSLDPGLSGKILKTINSAMFGLSRPVLSVPRALGLIGVNATRAMVLSLSLPEMNRGMQPGEHVRRYWKRSLACAVLARELAQRGKRPEPDEDLAAGLLCDLGVVILQQALPADYAEVLAGADRISGTALCARERALCGVDHAQVSAHVLRGWRFPDAFVDAIRCHHTPAQAPSPEIAARAQLLRLAGRLADLLTDGPQPELYRDILALANSQFGMTEKDLQEFVTPLQPKMQELAKIMSVDAGAWSNCAAVLAQATEELVAITVAAGQESARAQEEKAQAENEARRWRDEAACDHLTGLLNRRFFLERLRQEYARSRRLGHALGLLFIDLDGFKLLNDRFGHPFGDRVLQDIAGQLRQHVRTEDVVSRFGGDEFCILAWEMEEARLAVFADRILKCICTHVVRQGASQGLVGASIGAVVIDPRETVLSEEEIVRGADQAMYHAKKTGKNRVHVVTLAASELVAG